VPLIVLVAADHKVDNKELAYYYGVSARKVRLAKVDECRLYAGGTPGAIPPLGHPISMERLVHHSLQIQSTPDLPELPELPEPGGGDRTEDAHARFSAGFDRGKGSYMTCVIPIRELITKLEGQTPPTILRNPNPNSTTNQRSAFTHNIKRERKSDWRCPTDAERCSR